MSQVTIYLDSETEQRMREAARQAGVSRSQWLARLIREKTRSDWPDEVREAAGSWGDFPDAEELRANQGEDASRELL